MNDEAKEVTGMVVESALGDVVARAEIDQQIATAHRYPRSIRGFLDEARALVTLTTDVAGECVYALPRDGKTIEGPSARFAEILAHSWGNARAGARVVDDKGDFVTAQGVFLDLEKNVAITHEVQRRIVDKQGRRFKPDMIGVTANAACSIALRNAILKGVPKAFWQSLYEEARRVIMGDAKTLANRRAEALAYLQKFGASEAMVLGLLGIKGVEDITLEHLVTLRGIATAIKDGDTTVEQAFAQPEQEKAPLRAQVQRKSEQAPAQAPPEPEGPTLSEVVTAAAPAEVAAAASSPLEAFLNDIAAAEETAVLDQIEKDAKVDLTGSALKAVTEAIKNRRKDMTKGEQP